jgi:hypothetical protein
MTSKQKKQQQQEPPQPPFIYTGQAKRLFPRGRGMSHVSIQPPVKKLRQGAFKSKRTIHQVDFYDGLLGIGRQSFQSCHSLEQLQIPRTVQIIGTNAFYQCSQLREVELHSDGELEMIEDGAFA